MAAYLIADVEILDPEGFAEYQRRGAATYERYGARYLVRGGPFEVLEGDRRPRRLIVVEFPSAEQARAWYESPEHREIEPIRQQHARTNLILVEGA
jgi:uncharacterized protein (DUF1330 family)